MCKLSKGSGVLRGVIRILAIGLNLCGCGSEADDEGSYGPPVFYTPSGGGGGQSSRCCKYCTAGQPCGDTCISGHYYVTLPNHYV